MGPAIAARRRVEHHKKALDAAGADRLNARLAGIWPTLRRERLALTIPADTLAAVMAAAGGATPAAGLGAPAGPTCWAGLLGRIAAAEI